MNTVKTLETIFYLKNKFYTNSVCFKGFKNIEMKIMVSVIFS